MSTTGLSTDFNDLMLQRKMDEARQWNVVLSHNKIQFSENKTVAYCNNFEKGNFQSLFVHIPSKLFSLTIRLDEIGNNLFSFGLARTSFLMLHSLQVFGKSQNNWGISFANNQSIVASHGVTQSTFRNLQKGDTLRLEVDFDLVTACLIINNQLINYFQISENYGNKFSNYLIGCTLTKGYVISIITTPTINSKSYSIWNKITEKFNNNISDTTSKEILSANSPLLHPDTEIAVTDVTEVTDVMCIRHSTSNSRSSIISEIKTSQSRETSVHKIDLPDALLANFNIVNIDNNYNNIGNVNQIHAALHSNVNQSLPTRMDPTSHTLQRDEWEVNNPTSLSLEPQNLILLHSISRDSSDNSRTSSEMLPFYAEPVANFTNANTNTNSPHSIKPDHQHLKDSEKSKTATTAATSDEFPTLTSSIPAHNRKYLETLTYVRSHSLPSALSMSMATGGIGKADARKVNK